MEGLVGLTAAVVNLDQPGRYLTWSIFSVSVSNLVLIAVMVVIFGAALVLPFPKGRHDEEPLEPAVAPSEGPSPDEPRPPSTPTTPAPAGSSAGSDSMSRMWTGRLRRRAVSLLPPDKLLPDRQPAYVASWVYVFGVATLAALAMAVVTGLVIALGGADWWHTNVVGHFFNSLHLWSVELFMAFMVIHLWGKFWMAAWRGRRTMTWITGVVAFVASVVECFTGYLSQQNFDSQWISTNGKDAINATGFGGFFNLLNFGQMLLWHVVLVPIVLVAIVGAHVLLVRVHGVSHPLPARRTRTRAARRAAAAADASQWKGRTRPYDIVKEATAATLVVLVVTVLLASILSSPNEPPVTLRTWSQLAPADFLATAASELAGTSETATYGPPYNSGTNDVQRLLFSPQAIGGIHLNIDTAQAFVLGPLASFALTDPPLAAALGSYNAASAAQRQRWDQQYLKAVTSVHFVRDRPVLQSAGTGPVSTMLASELTVARAGGLDADLLAQHPFYGTDFTKPLLFLEDGNYFSALAQAQHLTGSQWGVMNETGSYPGQPWLWLYTLWYQVPGIKNSSNIDLIAICLTGVATLALLAVPFVPGLRDIPRLVPVHRLIWREWRSQIDPEPPTGRDRDRPR